MSKTSITIYKLITALFLVAYGTINAQYSISGPSSTDVNDTETFTAVNTSNLLGKNWNVTGSGITFTIVSGQGTSTSNIRFTSIGNAIVNFSAVTPGTFNSVFISKNVQVQGTVVGQVSITSGITERCKGSGTSDYNASASNATSYDWSLSPTSAGSINSNGTVTWNSNYSGTATVSVTANGPNNSS